MTKQMMLMIGGVVLAFGAWTAGADEIHPNWAELVATGAVSVPAGETWVADESDMVEINKLAANKLSLYGTLVLDNTTTWFATACWCQNGTLVKRGASTVTANVGSWAFYGTFDIQAGTVIQTTHYIVDGCRGAKTYVRDGATYRIDAVIRLGDVELHAAGSGVDGAGAIIVNSSGDGLLSYLELDDNATVAINCTDKKVLCGGVPGGRLLCYTPGRVKLNGHVLTLSGSGEKIRFEDVGFLGGGTLSLEGLASGYRQLSTMSCDFGTTELVANGDWKFPNADLSADVEIAAGKTLRFDPVAASIYTISGVLSGAGNVSFGASDAVCKGAVTLNAANTYTGATDVWGDPSFQLFLGYGTSIPDTEKLTIHGGTLSPSVGMSPDGTTPRWTADQVLALSKAQSLSRIVLGTTEATNDAALVISAADVAKYYPALDVVWDAFGTGLGHYTLTGPYADDKPLNLNILSGAVRLSGNDTITLGDVVVSGTAAGQGGTLILDGAKDVVYGEQVITLGSTSKDVADPVARMIVSNATLHSTYQPTAFTTFDTGALFVGRHAKGVLEVEDGAIVSNRMVIGGGTSANAGAGVGAVYQRGGTVRPFADNANTHLTAGIGIAGHGSYHLSGGLYRPLGRFNIGGYSSGCFLQTGGTAEYPEMFIMSSHANGKSYYTVLGGTTRMTDKVGYPNLVLNKGGLASLTVQGAGALFSILDSQYGIIYCGQQGAENDDHILYNLNDDGVFELGTMRVYSANYLSENPLIVNFNGGILRMSTSETPFCANTAFHLPKVVVYEKGIQIDATDGAVNGNNTGARFEAMKTGGIQTINLAEPLSGYPAIPRVDIVGNGDGATAIALVDEKACTVTNILVTSHGWGYTAANTTVTLRYGTTLKHTFAAADVVIADNDIGGFTKRGANTFTLLYENEWEKWTRVLGGTLKMGEAGSIPDGTALTISNGATIDFNNLAEPTFTAIGGTGGTAANGAIKVIGEDGVLSVSAQKFIDRESTAISGILDLSAVTEITLTDVDVLTEEAKSLKGLNLFSATTVVLPDGDVSITGVPKGWHARLTGRGLRLAPDKGMMLLFR